MTDVKDVSQKMYELQLSRKIALLQQRLLGVNISFPIVRKQVCFIPSKVFNSKRNRRKRSLLTQADLQQAPSKMQSFSPCMDVPEICINMYYAFSC